MRPAEIASPATSVAGRTRLGGAWVLAVLLALHLARPAGAEERVGPRPVKSLIELRNEGVVRQRWDLTCGAAAIATLMTYELNRPVTEREVVLAMLRRTQPILVRARLGFSLLDLKRYAAEQGLEATGYGTLTLADALAMAPLIVPTRVHGFRHFVVLRGFEAGRVLLADPAFGNRSETPQAFEADWANHVGFAVIDPADPRPPNRMIRNGQGALTPSHQALRAITTETALRASS